MKAAYSILFLLLISCSSLSKDKLIIAVSANMSSTARDLIKIFKEETGIDCELVVSSSGKIASQIMHGAPYDIFLAADTSYPEIIFQNGSGKFVFLFKFKLI